MPSVVPKYSSCLRESKLLSGARLRAALFSSRASTVSVSPPLHSSGSGPEPGKFPGESREKGGEREREREGERGRERARERQRQRERARESDGLK